MDAYGETPSQNTNASYPTLRGWLITVLKNNEEIKSFENQVEQAKARYSQSKGLYYPTMDLRADGGREKINKEFSADTEENRYNITLRANQLITDFGKTQDSIARSGVLLDQANARLESKRQQVLLQGITAYINIVKARERLRLSRQSEERIKELTGIEKTLVEKQAGLSSDVLQAKSQLAGAMALRVQAEGELSIARNRFQVIFSHALDTVEIEQFTDIEAPFEKLPAMIEEAVSTAQKQNPELMVALFNTQIAEKDIDIAKAAFYPQLNLYAEALRKDNEDGIKGYSDELSAGMEFRYNLFNGGMDRAALKSALANKNASSYNAEHAQKIIREQVNNSWEQLSILKQRSDLLEQQAEIVENFLILAKKERKMGTRSLLDVLNGEINFINAVASSIATRQDTKIAAYNLFFAMGNINLELFE
ncbi:MAG: TolC family protein [Desulfobacteraceae bacterium]|nr:TolC family protein [Desulfobacteraceae bacterium]